MNVIFGAGGFAREVAWLMDDLERNGVANIRPDYMVTVDSDPMIGHAVHGVHILGESDFFSRHRSEPIRAFLAVGTPSLRRQIYARCQEGLGNTEFPNIIHPSASYDRRDGAVRIGEGSIICAGSRLTTNVHVGDFVHVNPNCTLGHDSMIGSFTTLCPGSHVSGYSVIGEACFVGAGAVILPKITISDGVVIGAAAAVARDITEADTTWAGVPARRMQS